MFIDYVYANTKSLHCGFGLVVTMSVTGLAPAHSSPTSTLAANAGLLLKPTSTCLLKTRTNSGELSNQAHDAELKFT